MNELTEMNERVALINSGISIARELPEEDRAKLLNAIARLWWATANPPVVLEFSQPESQPTK
jgi:hypothetical protein